MSDSKPPRDLTCWDCGASNPLGSSECWLCQRRDWRGGPDPHPRQTIPPTPRGPLFPTAGGMVSIALIAVFAWIFRAAPGVAIALVVWVLPPWAITAVQADRRRRRAEPMCGLERAVWIVVLTILLPIALFVVFAGIAFLGIVLVVIYMFISRNGGLP